MMIRRHTAAVALVLAVFGCGGGNETPSRPTTVATPAPTPTPVPRLSIVDGVSGAPVAVVGAPATPAIGAALSLEAPGYLRRDQKFEGTTVALWPGDQGYVNDMVYWIGFTDGIYRLTRWRQAFTITLDGDLAEDPFIVEAAQEAVNEIQRTTGLAVRLGPGGECVLRVNPNDPVFANNAIAYSHSFYQGPTIVGNEIVFRNRSEIAGGAGTSFFRNTLLHEVGHTLGLGHSGSGFDVMHPGGVTNRGGKRPTFSENETAVLRMMYAHRKAGNQPPDIDPGLFAAAAQPRETLIID